MSYYDQLMQMGKTNPIGAATQMTLGLMRGDPDTMKLGYSFGSALIAGCEAFSISGDQMAVVAEKVVDQTTTHSSPTRRPYVVIICDGGIVQDRISDPGLGLPIIDVLDLDRGDESNEETIEFLDEVARVISELNRRDLTLHVWQREIDKLKARVSWPVDHAEGAG